MLSGSNYATTASSHISGIHSAVIVIIILIIISIVSLLLILVYRNRSKDKGRLIQVNIYCMAIDKLAKLL